VTADQLTKNLQLMEAALPSRNVDEKAGERRTAAYLAVLRGYSIDQIKYLSDRAIRTLRWFPPVAECLAIIGEYQPPETECDATLRLCAAFADDAFETWLDNVKGGDPLGDVPDQWLRIAVERGVVRRLDDGGYVSRALFVGPTMERKVTMQLSARENVAL
jgi:hypothetical protein